MNAMFFGLPQLKKIRKNKNKKRIISYQKRKGFTV